MKSLLYSRLSGRHWGAVVNRGASCLHRVYKPVGSKHRCHHFISKCAVNSQVKSVMPPKSPSETWPVQRGPGRENDYYLPHSSNVGDKPEGGQWERGPWRKRQRWGANHSSRTCWVWIRTSWCAPLAIFSFSCFRCVPLELEALSYLFDSLSRHCCPVQAWALSVCVCLLLLLLQSRSFALKSFSFLSSTTSILRTSPVSFHIWSYL